MQRRATIFILLNYVCRVPDGDIHHFFVSFTCYYMQRIPARWSPCGRKLFLIYIIPKRSNSVPHDEPFHCIIHFVLEETFKEMFSVGRHMFLILLNPL